MQQPPSIESLRRQLREKFPQAHAMRADPAPPAVPDDAGGDESAARLFRPDAFAAGAIFEVVRAAPVSGLGLLVADLLGDPAQASAHPEMVLIDGSDGFDPNSFSPAACSRVLWVRCRTAIEMLKAADLLVRDGNLPLVLLDATGLQRRDFQSLADSAWWRLKQMVEGNGACVVVLSSFAVVPCARHRWHLAADFTLGDMDDPREALRQRLRLIPQRLSRVN